MLNASKDSFVQTQNPKVYQYLFVSPQEWNKIEVDCLLSENRVQTSLHLACGQTTDKHSERTCMSTVRRNYRSNAAQMRRCAQQWTIWCEPAVFGCGGERDNAIGYEPTERRPGGLRGAVRPEVMGSVLSGELRRPGCGMWMMSTVRMQLYIYWLAYLKF